MVCDRFLRVAAVLDLIGISKAQLYRLMQDGAFPKPVALGPNTRAWLESDVKAWQADKVAARDSGADAALRTVNPNIGRGPPGRTR